ncbi:uncharacterized protein LOC110034789 [Phalaenopsis equestris]|uniref:uncharacterized protein LOC110034789 n=1 Tax=Phalaenopsis equestris TaxID=78828 RepID=UPI0009E3C216|nr:uncharacterized protein LOC110034789 [Phalaenopsis equestris]
MNQNPKLHPHNFPNQPNPKPNKNHEPLKVVYFSNPIRVTTSAAGFRGVVQELTGRDSDIAEILTRQPPISTPAASCDSPISARRRSSGTGEADGDDSFKLMDEWFGGTDDYFAGLLPISLLFDVE